MDTILRSMVKLAGPKMDFQYKSVANEYGAGDVALVIANRPFPHRTITAILQSLGLSVLDASGDDDLKELFAGTAPMAVLLAVDARERSDRALIASVAEHTRAWLIVLGLETESMASALDAGADAAVCEDDIETVAAQIRALVRRSRLEAFSSKPSGGSFPSVIEIGKLRIDRSGLVATLAGERLHFTPIEFRILWHLAQNTDRVATAEDTLSYAVRHRVKPEEAARNLKVYIRRLRRKMEAANVGIEVLNLRGVGYLLREHPVVADIGA